MGTQNRETKRKTTAASKTTKKTSARKGAGARRRASRKRKQRALPTVRLVPALPERLESVDVMQRLHEGLERREGDLNEALGRLEGSYRDLAGRLTDLEEKTREGAEKRLLEILSRARKSRANEIFGELEGRALDEADELLERVGLMRAVKHDALVAKARKRARAAGKRAERKSLAAQTKAAAAE